MGVIPASALLYFIGFTAFMLYINLVLMTRRHWSAAKQAGMGVQYGARAVSLAVALICVTAWAGYAAVRFDATGERLFSLSPVTSQVLDELDAEQPIVIQAFLSPDVPSEYGETRKRLVGLLRQFDEMGGKNLEVRYVDVNPYSTEAEEAEHFGIEPVTVMTEVDGRRVEAEIYLGAVVVSSYDKVVIPFFERSEFSPRMPSSWAAATGRSSRNCGSSTTSKKSCPRWKSTATSSMCCWLRCRPR
jgi:ABC-2 type transport system permease protein